MSARIIYKTRNERHEFEYYFEKELQVGDEEREDADWLFQAAIIHIIIDVLEKEEPDEVIEDGGEEAEDEDAEGPPLDVGRVVYDIEGGNADRQIQKVLPEKERKTSKQALDVERIFSDGVPGYLVETKQLKGGDLRDPINFNLNNPFFICEFLIYLCYHLLHARHDRVKLCYVRILIIHRGFVHQGI